MPRICKEFLKFSKKTHNPIFNMGKDFNRHFNKEDTWMSDKLTQVAQHP